MQQIWQLSRRQWQGRVHRVLREAQINAAKVAHRRCGQHRMMMVAMAILYTVVHVLSSIMQIAMPCVSTENLALRQRQKPTPSRFPLPMPPPLEFFYHCIKTKKKLTRAFR